ncbi:ribosome biogenesis protein WDR12 homolog isoform X2 [Schistocerca gregaria]|uniref:ribosome biogenesis protein WDR12 homolog isoform X2 n=1 Tax=Schistocerca gregaria TaxID=7010 RepID=UPI00211F4295|nr:ribosome biogenesis protein WDR12 homolog isoform X2 [Schistocerca gregaria]
MDFTRKQVFAPGRTFSSIRSTYRTQPEPEPAVDGEIVISHTMQLKKELLCVKYTPASEYIAAGFNDGQIGIFSSHQGKKYFLTDDDIRQSGSPITDLKHRLYQDTGNRRTITATYVDGRVKCWDYNKNDCIYTIPEHRITLGLAYHHSKPKFVTVGDDAKVFLYDEETKKQEMFFQASESPIYMDGHTSRIFAARFHPQLNYEFITGGWDSTVQFWDMRQPHSIRYLFGAHILTCCWQKENPLQLWDYTSGKLITNSQPDLQNAMLYCGKWISNDLIVCGGSSPNLLRIVDRRLMVTKASIKEFSRGVYSVDWGEIRSKKPRHRHLATVKGAPMSRNGYPLKVAFCAAKKIYECDLI